MFSNRHIARLGLWGLCVCFAIFAWDCGPTGLPQQECKEGEYACGTSPLIQLFCNAKGMWQQRACEALHACRGGQCVPIDPNNPPDAGVRDNKSTPETSAQDTGAPDPSTPPDNSTPPDPGNTCPQPAIRCLDAQQRQGCQDGRWSTYPCKEGFSCKQGDCVGSPCQDGSKRCLSSSTYEICSNQRWSTKSCPSGQACQFGLCVPASGSCTDGQRRCNGASAFEQCQGGRWQTAQACPAGQRCQNGTCAAGCTNECSSAGIRRCNGNDAQTCQKNAAGCLVWSTTTCPSGQSCQKGTCQASNFQCQLPAAQPQIASRHWMHPKSPYAGQTITLSVQSDKVKVEQAPPLHLEIVNRQGKRLVKQVAIVGGKTLYYLSAAGLAVGENCLIVRRTDGGVELATKVIARDPGAGIPRGNGVWKIKRNHQWTCSEQPTYGNRLEVHVRDENGKPLAGVKIRIDWTDDTVTPIKPDADSHKTHVRSMTTDSQGRAELYAFAGKRGIYSPIDSKPGWLVYLVRIEGGASDVATEITTGIWEALKQPNGSNCNFCNRYGVNVYGHWSYTIEFQRDPKATQVCDVPTDHAGQSGCGFHYHAYHEVGKTSCIPVAP